MMNETLSGIENQEMIEIKMNLDQNVPESYAVYIQPGNETNFDENVVESHTVYIKEEIVQDEVNFEADVCYDLQSKYFTC